MFHCIPFKKLGTEVANTRHSFYKEYQGKDTDKAKV